MGLAIDWGQDNGPQHIMITGTSKQEPLNFGNSRIGALRPAYEKIQASKDNSLCGCLQFGPHGLHEASTNMQEACGSRVRVLDLRRKSTRHVVIFRLLHK